MRTKLIAGALSLGFNAQALAECTKPVAYLAKGESAPCSGFLFSPDKELELRRKNEEYKFLMEQSKIYLQQIDLYKKELTTIEQIIEKEQKKTELWREAAENSTKKYLQFEENRGTRDWFFLFTGIGLTAISAWSLKQVTHN